MRMQSLGLTSILCCFFSFTEYVSRPKIAMNQQSNKNGTCKINLTCSMEQEGENVTYSWKAVGQAVSEFHDGPNLPIAWRPGDKDKTLICMARNPVSNSSSTPIFAQKLCEGDSLLFFQEPLVEERTSPLAPSSYGNRLCQLKSSGKPPGWEESGS